jgi:hypothetical protein
MSTLPVMQAKLVRDPAPHRRTTGIAVSVLSHGVTRILFFVTCFQFESDASPHTFQRERSTFAEIF